MVLTNSERHPRDHQDLVLHGLWVVHLVHQTITILSLFFLLFLHSFCVFCFFVGCTPDIPIIFSVFSFFAGWTPIVSNHHNPFWFKSVSPDISSCGSQGARGKGLWSRAPGWLKEENWRLSTFFHPPRLPCILQWFCQSQQSRRRRWWRSQRTRPSWWTRPSPSAPLVTSG